MPPRTTPAASTSPTLQWEGKRAPPDQVAPAHLTPIQTFAPKASVPDSALDSAPGVAPNQLYHGDNLGMLAALHAQEQRFRLIYADPPYGSGVNWTRKVRLRGASRTASRAVLARQIEYSDTQSEADYLQLIFDRLPLLRALLEEDGTLWLQCDHRHAHHLRVVLNEVFGAQNWLNTITWRSQTARGAKSAARYFPYSAHTIHIFARDARAKPVWTPPKRRIILSEADAEAMFMRDERGFFRTSDPGDYTYESLLRLHAEGRLYAPYGGVIVVDEARQRISCSHGGNIGIKYYLADLGGGKHQLERAVDNIWDDIPGLGTTPGEDTGYPTQKTIALLERILGAATLPGDRVLDPFCGSGTTLVAAQRMGRAWVGCDQSLRALQITMQRLYEARAADTVADNAAGFVFTRATPEAASALGEPASIAEPTQANEGARATLLITRNALDAARIQLDITGYTSPRLAAALEDAPYDWRCAVDAVEIDPDYRGDLLRVTIADAPVRRNRLVSGSYEVAAPHAGATIALRITDIFGEQALVLIPPP